MSAVVDPTAARIDLTRLAQAVIILAYIGLIATLYAHHQPWLDEAQAWSWATSLSNPVDFFIVPGEGHPPLWFWLLRLLSSILSFDQARLLMFGVAGINALLMARLCGRNVLLLAVLLLSNAFINTWGYHFRPYPLVLTLVLAALLLARDGRRVAGAWALTIACGFHFFAGFLFAFYLLVEWQRGLRIRSILLPAALALVFGLLAILSSMGNPDGTISFGRLPRYFLSMLVDPFWLGGTPNWILASGVALLAAFGLRKSPEILWPLAATGLLFAAAITIVYRRSEWHMVITLMLLVMAFSLSGEKTPRWPLIVLFLPQLLLTTGRVIIETSLPAYADEQAVAAVRADAGPDFDPTTQLIASPDMALDPEATRAGFSFSAPMASVRSDRSTGASARSCLSTSSFLSPPRRPIGSSATTAIPQSSRSTRRDEERCWFTPRPNPTGWTQSAPTASSPRPDSA